MKSVRIIILSTFTLFSIAPTRVQASTTGAVIASTVAVGSYLLAKHATTKLAELEKTGTVADAATKKKKRLYTIAQWASASVCACSTVAIPYLLFTSSPHKSSKKQPHPANSSAFSGITPAPDGRTKLHEAVIRGDVGAVRRLIAAGADANANDALGWSPFRLAATNEMRELQLQIAAEKAPNGRCMGRCKNIVRQINADDWDVGSDLNCVHFVCTPCKNIRVKCPGCQKPARNF